MADLYSHLCAHLQRAEAALINPDIAMPPVHLDMKKLHVETREQFFADIKNQILEFLSTFKPGVAGRKEIFFGALYNALLLATQAQEPLLKKKMLVKTYAWLLANKSRASSCEHFDKVHSMVFTAKSQLRPKQSKPREVRSSEDEDQSGEDSESPDVTQRKPLLSRTDFMVYTRPKEQPLEISPALNMRLIEYQRSQLRTVNDLLEGKRVVRSWSRAKSRAEERAMYHAEVKEIVRGQEAFPRTKVAMRPPTVVDFMKKRVATPGSLLRPKSKLDRAKMRAERLSLVEDSLQPMEAQELYSTCNEDVHNSMLELATIKYRLSQESIPVSFKTLAGGLMPPRPTMNMQLPLGGEFFTSNPFLKFAQQDKRSLRNALYV